MFSFAHRLQSMFLWIKSRNTSMSLCLTASLPVAIITNASKYTTSIDLYQLNDQQIGLDFGLTLGLELRVHPRARLRAHPQARTLG